MRTLFLTLAALLAAPFVAATTASAQITFTLNNVSFVVGTTAAGTVSGTFTTNSSTLASSTQLLSFNLTTTSTGSINGHSFAGFTYNSSNSSAYYNVGNLGLLTGFELDSPLGSTNANAPDTLRFYFPSHLTTSGATLGTTSPTISYEGELQSGGNRFVNAGTVTASAAPEPSSYVLGLLATTLFAALALRRRSVSL